MGVLLATAVESLWSLFYPAHCAMCLGHVACRQTLCQGCQSQIRRIEPPFCLKCSQPFDGTTLGVQECANCRGRHLFFQCAVTRHRSRGIVRALIHRFKYRGDFHLRHQLATWLFEGFEDHRLQNPLPDAVIPVPLYATRLREREYNQSEELTWMFSHRTGIETIHALRRIRPTLTQTRLSRTMRMENLRNAFEMSKNRSVLGMHLLLIDDVLTTGSTVAECARTLLGAGALSVRVMTVARG